MFVFDAAAESIDLVTVLFCIWIESFGQPEIRSLCILSDLVMICCLSSEEYVDGERDLLHRLLSEMSKCLLCFFGFIQEVLVDLVGLYNYQWSQPAQFWWWWWRKYTWKWINKIKQSRFIWNSRSLKDIIY